MESRKDSFSEDIKKKFLEETHIDPDYFLELVLKFIGVIEKDIYDPNESNTYIMNGNGKRFANIRINSGIFKITKISPPI